MSSAHPQGGSSRYEGGQSSSGASQVRGVAILIETSRAYGRGLLRGVARYHQEHRRWLTYFQPQGQDDAPPVWLANWKGDGIIARIGSQQTADLIRRAGVPAVDVRGMIANLGIPLIGVDNRALAELASRHLLERGFRRFGFCGFPIGQQHCMDQRREFFTQVVNGAGCRCDVFRLPEGRPKGNVWEWEQRHLAKWLKALSKPVGIMASNDDRGMQVLEACRRAGVIVPDEVAVVGVDNDEYLCNLAIPPLTSIDVHAERIGYEAAAMLDRLMDGQTLPEHLDPLPPRGVVARQSTDVLADADSDVLQALAFIRHHACDRIQVADVLRHVQSSRTLLEPKLKRVLGRTIHQEIQLLQIERVKNLLTTTDMPLKQIASQSGFKYVQYMSRAFRRATGLPPAQYRSQMGR